MAVIFYNDIMYAGGGGGSAYGGVNTPTSNIGSDGDFYYQFNELSEVAISYVKIGGTWHKIAGGDVNIGENYYTDKGKDVLMAIMSDEDAMAHEGIKEEEE